METSIKCPECGTDIDLTEVIGEQVKAEAKAYIKTEYHKVKREREELIEARKSIQESIRIGVERERAEITQRERAHAESENQSRFDALLKSIDERDKKIKDMNKAAAELEILKRKTASMESEYELKVQKEVSKAEERVRAEKQIKSDSENEMQLRERDKVIDDLKAQLKDMQQKAEQGSMQLQGEVQELAIEDWLENSFPLDQISEIKKGARGGDCLHLVKNQFGVVCGSIYYESKRTKDFQHSWFEKFKADMREKNADIGVIVTKTMPKDLERFGQIEGIWICTFEEFKALCHVLRDTVIRVSNMVEVQSNKSNKMEILYDYLTSSEFAGHVQAIVEGFTQLKADLDKEKNAMARLWKQREKQLDKVIQNTSMMYGSVKGIAGTSIQSVHQLEFDDPVA